MTDDSRPIYTYEGTTHWETCWMEDRLKHMGCKNRHIGQLQEGYSELIQAYHFANHDGPRDFRACRLAACINAQHNLGESHE